MIKPGLKNKMSAWKY